MRALVTGGAGFIGSNLASALVADGVAVRVLDDLSTGSMANLREAADEVEVVVGDVRAPDQVREAMADVDTVYHLAALPRVARSVADPFGTHLVNVNGTLNVLVAARDAGVRRLVFASSSSVYGDTPTLPKGEDMAPRPQSPYAASKLAGEGYCRAFSNVYGLEAVSLRFFNVFGPRQDPTGEYATAVPRFISRMLAGLPPTIFGDGKQSRDFTHIDNVVKACRLAADADRGVAGEAINVGCGDRTSLLDLIDLLNDLLGATIEPEFADPRPGDVRDTEASVEKAEQLLGYRPEIDLREGMARTVAWFRDEAPILWGSPG
ncbi:MAG: SDR family NAD(P)-dependent oxidoreductase [Actinomycetota bacterium]